MVGAEIGKSPEATIYDMRQTFLLTDLEIEKHFNLTNRFSSRLQPVIFRLRTGLL